MEVVALRGRTTFRSSRSQMFFKIDALKNFANFTGKHLCWSLFFNKVSFERSATLLKKRLQHRCFPVKFAKYLRASFFTEHLRWLLLNFVLKQSYMTAFALSNSFLKFSENRPFWKSTLKCWCRSLAILPQIDYRNIRPEVFCKNGVLRNFAKSTGKHLCQSLFFNKVAVEASNFIKKETVAQVFSLEFCKIFQKTFSYRTPPVAASKTKPWIKRTFFENVLQE